MRSAAAERGLTLMVGHTFEYHAAVWKLREMVDAGELGELYYLDTARLNLGLYQHDVNVVVRPGPARHLHPQLRAAVPGRWPWSAGGPGTRTAASRTSPTSGCSTRTPRVEANVHVSWLDPCKVRRVTVVGSDKMVVFDDLAAEERIRVHDKGVAESAGDPATSASRRCPTGTATWWRRTWWSTNRSRSRTSTSWTAC